MCFLFLLLSCALNAGEPGPLVIVGGGGMPETVRKHFVEIAVNNLTKKGILICEIGKLVMIQ